MCSPICRVRPSSPLPAPPPTRPGICEYGDFSDLSEVQDLIEPFLKEVGASSSDVSGLLAASPAVRALKERRDEEELHAKELKLATPVSLQTLSSAFDAAVAQQLGKMTGESTVNSDRFERAAALIASERPRRNKEEAPQAPPPRSLPSTFVKRHRIGPAGTKQITVRGVDVRVGGQTLIKDAVLSLSYGRKYGLGTPLLPFLTLSSSFALSGTQWSGKELPAQVHGRR